MTPIDAPVLDACIGSRYSRLLLAFIGGDEAIATIVAITDVSLRVGVIIPRHQVKAADGGARRVAVLLHQVTLAATGIALADVNLHVAELFDVTAELTESAKVAIARVFYARDAAKRILLFRRRSRDEPDEN